MTIRAAQADHVLEGDTPESAPRPALEAGR
jgi:hypothetical protein